MNLQQTRALLWLRWRLTYNQFTRGSGIAGAVAALLAALGIGSGLSLGLGSVLAGAVLLSKASPFHLQIVWDALTVFVLFFWLVAILIQLQRSETIELTRLMHLPVALNEVFLLNYLASHLNLAMVITFPAMLGLAIGLALGTRPNNAAACAACALFRVHDNCVGLLAARVAGNPDARQAPAPRHCCLCRARHRPARAAAEPTEPVCLPTGAGGAPKAALHSVHTRKRASRLQRHQPTSR